jgi:hypothetical protein
MEGLLEGLGGVLRLAAVSREALVRFETTAPSGFGVALLIGFGAGHGVLLPRGVTTLAKWRRQ